MKDGEIVKKKQPLMAIYKEAKPPKDIVIKFMINRALLAVLLVVESYFFGKVIDLAGSPVEEILPPVIFITIITVTEYCFTVFGPKYEAEIIEYGLFSIRTKIISSIANMALNQNVSTGDLMSRSMGDLNNVSSFVQTQLFPFYMSMYTFIMGLILCIIVSPILTIVGFFFVPIVIYLGVKHSELQEKYTVDARKTIGETNSVLRNILSSVTAVKAFNLYKEMNAKFKKSTELYINAESKVSKVRAYLTPLFLCFWFVPNLFTDFIGGYLVIKGVISAGDFIVFSFTFGMVTDTMMQFKDFIFGARKANASAIRVLGLFDLKLEESLDALDVSIKENVIEVNNVSFSYNNEDSVLKNININVKKGEVIAIVGPSGSGKSTLIKLLSGIVTGYHGSAMINDVLINEQNYKTIRNQLSIVSQENFLFPESILYNISFDNKEYSRKMIEEACKQADIHDFIMSLPNGYESIIGEKGCNLSGGQRQRLCIARAFLYNKDILFLDEPTSALDVISENYIQQTLSKLMKNKTVVIIAHRLATIKNVDRIIVMKSGEIVEMGNHQDLMKLGGEYHHLYTSH